MKQTMLRFALLGSAALLWPQFSPAAPALYWTFSSPNGVQPVIMRSNLDGTDVEPLVSSAMGGHRSLALDLAGEHMYVGYDGTITRYDYDGTNPTTIYETATNPGGVSGIALDPIGDRLYWTFSSPNGVQPVIMRSNLDGTDVEPLVSSAMGGHRSLALDLAGEHMYLGYDGTITRYDYDGTNPTIIYHTATNPGGVSGIALDPIGDKLYWTFSSPNGVQPVIMRSNLDGTDVEPLVSSAMGGHRSLALDLAGEHMYLGYDGTITRYDYDGTSATTIYDTATNPAGVSDIGIVPEPSSLALLGMGAVALLAYAWRKRR